MYFEVAKKVEKKLQNSTTQTIVKSEEDDIGVICTVVGHETVVGHVILFIKE